MVNGNYKLEEVMGMGYYAAYRIWTILDEAVAKQLKNLSIINDMPHATAEYREEVCAWLNSRMKRSSPKIEEIPKEVRDKFKGIFNNGR